MGSPDFAVPSLEALCRSDRYRPILVVSQPDRGKGRGRKLSPTPVRARALELGLETRVMSKSTYADVAGEISVLRPDVIAVVAFGIILKSDLLDLPRLGCVNVHASLLPRHRGVSPIQAAILAGDDATGCTTMKMDAGIDTGGILLAESVSIGSSDTTGTLSDRLAALGAGLLVRTLDAMRDGTLTPRAQDDSLSSYAPKIQKTDGEIDWTAGAVDVDRRIRAMSPWPSAYTFHQGKRLIVIEASPTGASAPDEPEPGTVVATDPLTVACGDGAIVLRRVKREGRPATDAASFVAGHSIGPQTRLGRGESS
jgi:methionyl-tRNA formyltransferase